MHLYGTLHCMPNWHIWKHQNSMIELLEVSISEYLQFKKKIDAEISEKTIWIAYVISGLVGNCKQTIFYFRPVSAVVFRCCINFCKIQTVIIV
jgi:hypothetical protein